MDWTDGPSDGRLFHSLSWPFLRSRVPITSSGWVSTTGADPEFTLSSCHKIDRLVPLWMFWCWRMKCVIGDVSWKKNKNYTNVSISFAFILGYLYSLWLFDEIAKNYKRPVSPCSFLWTINCTVRDLWSIFCMVVPPYGTSERKGKLFLLPVRSQ